jgi:hypothetical protein
VALVDLANVHSNCRLCIRTADLHRKEVGPVRKGQPEGERRPSGRALGNEINEGEQRDSRRLSCANRGTW